MNVELKSKLGDVLKMIQYMGNEIKGNMSKYILLSTNEPDKYAIKFYVSPNMVVGFALLNTENNSMAYKEYTYEEFAALCSDIIVMQNVFTKLSDDLIEAVQVQHKEPKEIKDSFIF